MKFFSTKCQCDDRISIIGVVTYCPKCYDRAMFRGGICIIGLVVCAAIIVVAVLF